LKRLSLYRVDDVPLETLPIGKVGELSAPARARLLAHPFEYLLVLDADNRPLGWAGLSSVSSADEITADMAHASSPHLDRRTTLKDALSMLLDATVQVGVVVDRHGAYRGILTVDGIANWIRGQDRARAE
jgi:osmoprotectant transport system ATP-binding protein